MRYTQTPTATNFSCYLSIQMFDQLVDQMKTRNGVTEQLKVTDQMKWVRRMNAVRYEATEIIAKELIYDEAP